MNIIAVIRAMYRLGLESVHIKNIYEFQDGTVSVTYGHFPYQQIKLQKSELS